MKGKSSIHLDKKKSILDGWKKNELSELVFTISPPIKLNTTDYLENGKYPIVDQGKKLIVGYTNNDTAVFHEIPAVVFGDHTKEVKFIDFPFAVGADGVKILDSNEIEKKYLKFVLEEALKKLPDLGYSRYFSELKNIVITFPDKAEQCAIAQVLSTADAAIQTTEKLIAQKELRKKWLMQQLLTGKKRLQGFAGEWKEYKLSDLFERVTRKNDEGNTNVVTISAQRGFVKQNDFFNKTVASETLDNYFLVQRGEFCYNKSYSNGYPWGATKRLNAFDKAVVTTLYICFSIKDENKANADFFEQFFEANLLDKGLTKIAHEGGRAHGLLNVTPSDFFSLKFMAPSLEEQTAIAQVLQAADKEISLLKVKAQKLKEQKKGLMQQLLTGKVRLKID